MPVRPILYYITDRSAFAGEESIRRRRLLEKIAEACRAGVDYIQLREKDLPTRELERLAREVVGAVHEASSACRTALLINSRTDVAIAVGADGVHLRSDDVSPREVLEVWSASGEKSSSAIIGVSCHSPAEVTHAAASGATFAVFAPVFEKKDAEAAGLGLLREACRTAMPVLALGGVTLANFQSCIDAGAAGIAAIRLFQENDVGEVVKRLRPAI